MKKKCKDIDITDIQTVRPWVEDCIRRHKKRHDFRKLIIHHGTVEEIYWKAVNENDFSLLQPAVDRIAEDAVRQIKARHLELEPVRIREQEDKTTGKITVKKGTKKGTYKMKVKVTAKNANYTSFSKTITVKVQVK